jgi:septal ring factor EnvC (AmiA/AmiB activator)
MIEGLSNNRNQRTENEQALYNEYNKVKDQLEELKIKRSELEAQVNSFYMYY